jgi:hypothetical protein
MVELFTAVVNCAIYKPFVSKSEDYVTFESNRLGWNENSEVATTSCECQSIILLLPFVVKQICMQRIIQQSGEDGCVMWTQN